MEMYRYVKKHRINVTIVISIYWAESDLKKECVLKSGLNYVKNINSQGNFFS